MPVVTRALQAHKLPCVDNNTETRNRIEVTTNSFRRSSSRAYGYQVQIDPPKRQKRRIYI
jgi:hypothetical protein